MLRQLLLCQMGIVLLTLPGKSQTPSQDTLKGLHEFHILIEKFTEDTASIGLLKADVRREVELKLRLAGIKMNDDLRAPIIYVVVSVVALKPTSGYAYYITVQVLQNAKLSISHQEAFNVMTWKTSSMGYAGDDLIKNVIRDVLIKKMDIFLNAYLSVNPRTR